MPQAVAHQVATKGACRPSLSANCSALEPGASISALNNPTRMPRSMRWIVLKPRRHSKTRATCESAVMSLRLLSIESPGLLLVGQKQLQQVVQEVLTARRRTEVSVRPREQSEPLRLIELAFHQAQG